METEEIDAWQVLPGDRIKVYRYGKLVHGKDFQTVLEVESSHAGSVVDGVTVRYSSNPAAYDHTIFNGDLVERLES
jgi:hypothetical protein